MQFIIINQSLSRIHSLNKQHIKMKYNKNIKNTKSKNIIQQIYKIAWNKIIDIYISFKKYYKIYITCILIFIFIKVFRNNKSDINLNDPRLLSHHVLNTN